jgi:hypothetical protein
MPHWDTGRFIIAPTKGHGAKTKNRKYLKCESWLCGATSVLLAQNREKSKARKDKLQGSIYSPERKLIHLKEELTCEVLCC